MDFDEWVKLDLDYIKSLDSDAGFKDPFKKQ